jgi:energy coupling factor transporter S component ThiW
LLCKGKTLPAVFSLRILMNQRSFFTMKEHQTKKLAVAGILCAVAVVGSLFSFPVFGSRCAPVQHMVNILCAVFLGPWYGVGAAFVASLLRNLLSLGSLLAFPGSMCGALLCGLAFRKSGNLPLTLVAEVFGTGILGGLLSYPIAVAFMGVAAGSIAFYAYVVPFLVSTVGGSILAGALVFALQKSGALTSMRASLEH